MEKPKNWLADTAHGMLKNALKKVLIDVGLVMALIIAEKLLRKELVKEKESTE